MIENCYWKDTCNGRACANNFCIRQYKLENLYKLSLLADNQKKRVALVVDADKTDLEEFKQLADIEKNILNFVKTGQNLYLYSTVCGNGKTSWSIRMIQAYFNLIWASSELKCRALFVSVPRYIIAMKDKISAQDSYFEFVKQNIGEADLVVWDDIATKIATQYELDRLLPEIDTRIAKGKANIYTSNLRPDEVAKALDPRLASRICQKSLQIELHGGDKRGLILNGGLING